MLGLLLAVLAAAPDEPAEELVDLRAAQAAYLDAEYERALMALGDDCAQSKKPVACERLRAFVHVALGDTTQARAAFDRMLAYDVNATLGSDVAPKLQALFGEAQKAMAEVQALRITPPDGVLGETVLLEVKNPASDPFEELAMIVGLPGRDLETVTLAKQGEIWAGSWRVGSDPPAGDASYVMLAKLRSGAVVKVGDPGKPFTFDLGTAARRGKKEAPPEQTEGLPSWAPWAIGGGAAVVVITAVVVGVVLGTQPPAPGSVAIDVVFHEP